MLMLMEKMQFGKDFISAGSSMYSSPKSAIKVNSELSENFKIEKGTRQGCPISPLLFIMVLEVLLRQVKEDKEINGLKTKGFVY